MQSRDISPERRPINGLCAVDVSTLSAAILILILTLLGTVQSVGHPGFVNEGQLRLMIYRRLFCQLIAFNCN